MTGRQGRPDPTTQLARANLKPGQLLTPRAMKAAIDELCMAEDRMPVPLMAVHIRKRWRKGEWPMDDFPHLDKWTTADWVIEIERGMKRAKDLKRARAMPELSAFAKAEGKRIGATLERGKQQIKRQIAKVAAEEARELLVAQRRAKQAKLEAETKESLPKVSPEELDLDAKKNLELLRRAILSKMPIEEQADLLVSIARSDNSAQARAMLAKIIEITGLQGANTPEAPGLGPIFALPEGAGPSIR